MQSGGLPAPAADRATPALVGQVPTICETTANPSDWGVQVRLTATLVGRRPRPCQAGSGRGADPARRRLTDQRKPTRADARETSANGKIRQVGSSLPT